MQASLEFGIPPTTSTWKPKLPETLEPWSRVYLDTETTGLDLWGADVPCGYALAVWDSGQWRSWYLPVGHTEGPNLERSTVREFLREQLYGKDIVFCNGPFDIQMCRKDGIDLEALQVNPHEVQHQAALLDDRRQSFRLDAMGQRTLGRGKVKFPTWAEQLPMHRRPSWMVATYACGDAELTGDLDHAYMPRIRAEELEEVLALEDRLLYCTLEMMRNGAPLDVPKLKRWKKQLENEVISRVMELHRRTGIRIRPTAPAADLAKLFKHLGMDFGLTLEGAPSFTEDFLKRTAGHWTESKKWVTDCVDVQLALETRQLQSLLDKYVDAYLESIGPDGILRYSLHQMRSDDYGTISGRYSASNKNIQQVMKPDKQEPVTKPWTIREVFIPPPGRIWCSADASQIEFRMLAHYISEAGISTRLEDEYRKNPRVDFHQLVTDVVLKGIMSRTLAKNFNFMKVYGGGVRKVAFMTGKDLDEAKEMDDKYNELFPEAGALMRRVTRVAERRGYVKTILGRRARLSDKFYAALNRILQGTAADLNKLNLDVVYRERKTLDQTMRFTVHDEIDNDTSSKKKAKQLEEMLNESKCPKIRVPVLWEVGTGKNWAEAH